MSRFNKSGGLTDFLTNPIFLIVVGFMAITSWMKLRRLENTLTDTLTQ